MRPPGGMVQGQPISSGLGRQPLSQGGSHSPLQQVNPWRQVERQTNVPVVVSQRGPWQAGQSGMSSLQRSGLTQRPVVLHT
jgi:hypothetical protein